jgi:DNA-3-methyladenine glycosylase II
VRDKQAKAVQYLANACDVMASLTRTYNPVLLEPKPPEQYFHIVVSSIIGQQLSVKAANTIESRVWEKVGEKAPEALLTHTPESLREVGLSRSKASYILGVAEAFVKGVIDPKTMELMEPEEVRKTLTSLKGIGPWTAEMFLIFAMGREDVWSPGDLGLKNAVWAHFGEGVNTEEVATRWAPYRSYAALYLWEYVDQGKA